MNNTDHEAVKNAMHDLMLKVAQSPGLCTKDEIRAVYWWLQNFKKLLDEYRAVYGEPAGLSVQSHLDSLNYYMER